jgi:hypothetical protein
LNIHDNNDKRNLLINAEKPEVEMPVVWLLRYANRTSNLKTALTRKYRIINHTRLYQLHLATNWESNSQTSVVIRIVCINSVKLQLDYDIHLLGSCNNSVNSNDIHEYCKATDK